jgi:hypothetical protein
MNSFNLPSSIANGIAPQKKDGMPFLPEERKRVALRFWQDLKQAESNRQ